MKEKNLVRLGILLSLSVLLFLAGCRLAVRELPTQSPDALYTSAAQTVQAQLTQNALGTQIAFPTSTQAVIEPLATATATTQPTDTPVPTNTPLPTNTPVPPTKTPVPVPCDLAGFVKDVTYPDNTEVPPGTTFIKTWRLRNDGTCTWNSSYDLVFDSGDAMSGQASVQLTSGTVAPGQSLDVSVSLKAPTTAKTYQGYWKLRNGAGIVFGVGSASKAFWVKIVVPSATATPKITAVTGDFDFVAKGPKASWANATKSVEWGDPENDKNGVATSLSSVVMEDGNTYSNVLATYPQKIEDGIIYGIYPYYKVQSGYYFRAKIGLKEGCTGGKVRFVLKYILGGTEKKLADWTKSCDGSLVVVEKDLSSLAGEKVYFILKVDAEGDFKGDKAIWINPRIED